MMERLATTTAMSWSSVLSTIVATDEHGQNKAIKCSVRVLDTVFLGNAQDKINLSWYFTTRNGLLARKKSGSSSSLSNVADRFSKFALSNPNNSSGFVGVLYRTNELGDGHHRIFLDANQLNENIHSVDSQKHFIQQGDFLQVYLRPFRGDDFIHVCQANSDSNLNYSFLMSKKSLITGQEIAPSSSSKSINKQMETSVTELIKFLSDHRGINTENITAEFIVDDNENIWLSNITKFNSIVSPSSANIPVLRGKSAGARPISPNSDKGKRNNVPPFGTDNAVHGERTSRTDSSDSIQDGRDLPRPRSDSSLKRRLELK